MKDRQYQLNKWSKEFSPCKDCEGNPNKKPRTFHCSILDKSVDRGRIIACIDFKKS